MVKKLIIIFTVGLFTILELVIDKIQGFRMNSMSAIKKNFMHENRTPLCL